MGRKDKTERKGEEVERSRREGARESVNPMDRKVASSPLHRSLVERRSWAADLAHPKLLAWRPLITDYPLPST